jgi:hypothetical protein
VTRLLLMLLAAGALLPAGCGGEERDAVAPPTDPAATPSPPAVSPDGPVTEPLQDVGGLGVSGEVTLASAGADRTDVAVGLDGAGGAAFSASIREGSCDDSGEVVHDLGVVEEGTSNLVAGAPLQGLLSRERTFVLTAAEDDGVVACADLPVRAG